MANKGTCRCSPFTLLLLFLFGFCPFVTALSFGFNFTRPNGVKSAKDIVLEGDASSTITGIQLTNASISQDAVSIGRALYRDTFRLWDAASGDLLSFTTHFSFKINSFFNNCIGDGFAFFLVPPSERPIPAKSNGSNLGLFNNSANRVVAVEFDSYQNDFDPYGDHIGIDVYSIKSVATTSLGNFSISNGTNAPLATVAYDGRTMNLTVLLTYPSTDPFVDDQVWIASSVVDFRDYLPEEVVMGFSASTGMCKEGHSILSWDFNSTDLEIRSPTPAEAGALVEMPLEVKVHLFKDWDSMWSHYSD